MLELVFVTFPTPEKAHEISKLLVERKLCACVNILSNISSVYSWEGKLCQEKEALAIYKTERSKRSDLERALLELHPYDTPEFVALEASYVTKKYLDWVKANLT